MDDLNRLVKEFDGFPSLSCTVNQIIDLFNKGNVDINILEQSLKKDPNLSLQVLRLANSPFFGISGEVTSIKDACMIMGLTNVFNLVTAADVLNALKGSKHNMLNSAGFWEHSISVGIATTIILKKAKLDDSKGFLAGLLHDIGKLALDTYQPALYEKVLDYQERESCSFTQAEVEIASFTHAQLGFEITNYWNLDKTLGQIILYHHDSHNVTKNETISALHIANFLIKGLDIGDVNNNSIFEFYTRSVVNIGLKMNDLYGLMEEIERSTQDNALLDLVH